MFEFIDFGFWFYKLHMSSHRILCYGWFNEQIVAFIIHQLDELIQSHKLQLPICYQQSKSSILFYSNPQQQTPTSQSQQTPQTTTKMHTKLINNRMQELKRHQTLTHPPTSIDVEDKENILINRYEKEQSEKKNKKKYLQQVEELIMNERLKEIVADNVQYFRNILEAKQVYRPNSHTLKLPGKMVPTLYQSDYLKRKQFQSQSSSIDMQRSHFNRTQNCSESKLPATTTYQNEFRKVQEIKTKQTRNSRVDYQLFKRSISNNAPTFLDTHNSLQYRNWGTGSVMPSMKPSPKAATTDVPFKACSMYRTDFHNVTLPRTKMVTHQQTFPQSVDLWMGKTSYEKDFEKKKVRVPEQGYKPRETPGATNLPFKSTTEYKESFMESVQVDGDKNPLTRQKFKKHSSSSKKLTNQDIERLVMDL